MLVDLSLINIASDYAGSVTFQGETAGYRNTLGMYRVDANGNIKDVSIIFANASQTGGGGNLTPGVSTVNLSLHSSERVGFFILSNAFSQSTASLLTATTGHYEFRNAGGGTANVADTANPTLYHVSTTGTATALLTQYGTTSFHAAAESYNNYALNGDAFDHTRWTSEIANGRIVLRMAFEDLYAGGDKNFNDVTFVLDIGAVNTVVNAPATIAEVVASLAPVDDAISLAAHETRTLSLLANDATAGASGVRIAGFAGKAATVGQPVALDTGETITLNADGTVTVMGGIGNTSTTVSYVVTDDAGNVGTARITITSSPVDGTEGNDLMSVGFRDLDGTFIDGTDGLNDVIYGHGGNDRAMGGEGRDVIDGGSGNDFIRAGREDDTLIGGDGNDVLDGQAGADSLAGGAGDDVYWLDNAGDLIVEGAGGGWDKVLSNLDHVLATECEELWLNEGSAAGVGTGNALGNKMVGNANPNTLAGLTGDDTLFGGGSDDSLEGGGGSDLMFGGSGDDVLLGGSSRDKLYSGAGDDVLFGGAGMDQLSAEGEHARLVGGIGADLLCAGAGADTLVFARGDGRDTVKDFTPGVDHLEFHGLTLADLTIVTRLGATRIFYGDGDVVILGNLDGTLGAQDFLFA